MSRSRPRPLRSIVAALTRASPQLGTRLNKLAWRAVYEAASVGGHAGRLATMNYGYAPVGPGLEHWPENERPGLALYARVAGAAQLGGKDVLEVGCGRGAGAALVFEQFGPRLMTGLDLAHRAVSRARSRFGRAGLEFVAGDAERLPFPDGRFDAVLSVESSHCYASVPRFLGEVHRVLAPGGVLLLADLRWVEAAQARGGVVFNHDDLDRLRAQLADADFRILEEEDITANVVRALELNTPSVRARIERRYPAFLRRHALAFVAVEGSATHRALAGGDIRYMRFVLARV